MKHSLFSVDVGVQVDDRKTREFKRVLLVCLTCAPCHPQDMEQETGRQTDKQTNKQTSELILVSLTFTTDSRLY
jgi:hypothetical protein